MEDTLSYIERIKTCQSELSASTESDQAMTDVQARLAVEIEILMTKLERLIAAHKQLTGR